MIVVDASITVAWLLAEEEAASTRSVYEQVMQTGIAGPAIYQIEVLNALRTAFAARA